MLWGGESSEREVSKVSAMNVGNGLKPFRTKLNKKKYELEVVEMGEKGWIERLMKSEVVFIAMHGKYGEDGRIQGLLDCLKIPYIGSGVLASAIGMDKLVFRKLVS